MFSRALSVFKDLRWPDQAHLGPPPRHPLPVAQECPFKLSPDVSYVIDVPDFSPGLDVTWFDLTWFATSCLHDDGWAAGGTCPLAALQSQAWIILLRYAGKASLVVRLLPLPGLWSLSACAVPFFVKEPQSQSFVTMLTIFLLKLGLLHA